MENESESVAAKIEIGLAVFFIAVCTAVLWAAFDIPPGVFEPLGAAPVPQGVAATIMLLAILMLGAALRRLRREKTAAAPSRGFQPRPFAAAAVCALGIIYVALMQAELLSFALATALFLFASVGVLARWRFYAAAVAIAVGLITGYGLQYVFTRVFVIDLPLG